MARKHFVVSYGSGDERHFTSLDHKNPYNESKQFAISNAPSRWSEIKGDEEHHIDEFWLVTDSFQQTTVINEMGEAYD